MEINLTASRVGRTKDIYADSMRSTPELTSSHLHSKLFDVFHAFRVASITTTTLCLANVYNISHFDI